MIAKYNFSFLSLIAGTLLMLNSHSVLADSAVHACVANSTGAARIVTATTKCAVGETKKSWNNLTPINTIGVNSGIENSYVRITSVSINGGSNQAHVAPDATYTVAFDYSIKDAVCPNCIEQIEVGLASGKPQACVYNNIPGSTGETANGSVTLIAPSEPGIYYVAYDRASQFSCDNAIALNKWSSFVKSPGLRNYIGAIAVY